MRKMILLKNKVKIFEYLKNNLKEMKTLKTIQQKEKECQDKLNEMSQFYGKEINDLRTKLNEANKLIEKYKESKSVLQDNLKKALMRGVVAMNLEAMNVLEGDGTSNSSIKIMENLMGNLNLSNTSSNSNILNNKNISVQSESNLNTQNSLKNEEKTLNKANINPTSIKNVPTNAENFENSKKLVVKDNNWVNASAVPAKMKSNIISTENENENEFEESFRVKSTRNQITRQKSNPNVLTSLSSQPKSVHEELSKSNLTYKTY
jgi:hypothetical protein